MGSLFRKKPEDELRDALEKCNWGRFKAVIRQHPELVNIRVEGGSTPLHKVLSCGKTDELQILIDSNADLNARDGQGRTPLHLALLDGHVDAARLLILNQADINARDKDGGTPLDLASFLGHKEIADLIRNQIKNSRQVR